VLGFGDGESRAPRRCNLRRQINRENASSINSPRHVFYKHQTLASLLYLIGIHIMFHCTHCKVRVKEKSSTVLSPTLTIVKLACGHSKILGPLKPDADIDKFLQTFESRDSKKFHLYPYQQEDTHRASRAFGRCLFRYEVGLGKTPTSLACVEAFGLHPAIILTKTTLVYQWLREIFRWTGKVGRIIKSTKDLKDPSIQIFPYLIMSIDLVRSFDEEDLLVFPDKEYPARTVIIDECQAIKNTESARTVATKKLCKNKEHIVACSATPIKNRFDEYYPVLNLMRPDLFPSYRSFVDTWCESTSGPYGEKVGACKDPKGFEDYTKNFIFHRTKDEVLPDLPKTRRNFRYYDLEAQVKKAYEKLLEEFADYYENTSDKGFELAQNLLAYFAKMRHLTGLAKIDDCIREAEEFILSCNRKLTIGVHHKLVGDMIQHKLNESLKAGGFEDCLYLHSELNSLERSKLIEEFRTNPGRRILLASTLAAGEGLNLQFCSDAILVERQWNPANEEQFEGRFSRIGQEADSIDITYLVAIGTIDEWLTELIEKKREIVKTAYGEEGKISENTIILELAEILISKRGGKKWKAKL
jgi:SNF2 family DNA or RNA helicase